MGNACMGNACMGNAYLGNACMGNTWGMYGERMGKCMGNTWSMHTDAPVCFLCIPHVFPMHAFPRHAFPMCFPAHPCTSKSKSFKIHQNFYASTQNNSHNIFLHCFSLHSCHYFLKQMRNTFRLPTESLQKSPKSIKIHQLFYLSSLNTFATSI